MRYSSSGVLLGLASAAAALETLAPPVAVGRTLVVPATGGDPTAYLVALTAAAAWLVLAWLAAGSVVALVGRLPGTVGRAADRLAAHVTPAVVRRLLGTGAAAGLALAPVVAGGTAWAAPSAPAVAAAASTCSPLPSLDRVPCLYPTTATAAPPIPAAPAPAPSAPAPAAAPHAAPRAEPVIVRPGDSLWSLATAELRRDRLPLTPGAVAARWPAWWQANRAVIGDDPGLIHPGTPLVPPTAAPEELR